MQEADVTRWWDADGDPVDRACNLFNHARDLEIRHEDQHTNNLLYSQLYSNRELPSFDWGMGVEYDHSLSPISRLSENLSLSVVDTMVSQIGKNRPKPAVVLRGAPWKLRKTARKLDRWLYANFLNQGIYSKGKAAFRDAAISGFGALRIDVEGKKLCVERVFYDDVLVDQRECHGDTPPIHVLTRRVLPIESVCAMYDLEYQDVQASAQKQYLGYRGVGQGFVVVIEGFRRAIDAYDGSRVPGRRFLAIDGVLLDDEVWDEDWFPLVFFRWSDPPSGWYCPSAVEQVLPYQLRLNEINEVIREAQDLMSRPRVFIPEGSRINVSQIDNVIGKVFKYTGPLKPEALNWQAVSAELYGERDRLVRSCYEFLGISQLSAQSKPPANWRGDSAPALREMNMIEDGRFADLAQRYEEFYMRIAETMIRVVQKYGIDVESTWWKGGGSASAETIKWSDINLDRDRYVLTLEPSSVLNQTPAARRDELERMLAQGTITPAQYQQHYNNPDLDDLFSLGAAMEEHTDMVIGELEDGKAMEPTEFDINPAALVKLHMAMTRLKVKWTDPDDPVPEEVIDAFVAYLLHGKAILDEVSGKEMSAAQSAVPVQ